MTATIGVGVALAGLILRQGQTLREDIKELRQEVKERGKRIDKQGNSTDDKISKLGDRLGQVAQCACLLKIVHCAT